MLGPRAIAWSTLLIGLVAAATGCGGGSDEGRGKEATVAVGRKPTAIAVGHGSVWVANYGGSVRKPQPTPATTNEDGETIPARVPAESEESGTVLRIDPRTNEVTAKIIVNRGPCLLTVTDGGVYVSNCRDGTVSRIDPVTNRLAVTFPGYATAAAAGSIWTTDATSRVLRLDPLTGQKSAEIATGAQPASIVGHNGSIWVANAGNSTISRIDPATNTPVKTVSGAVGTLALTGNTLWLKSSGAPSTLVVAFDSQTLDRVEQLTIDSATTDLAVGADSLWVRTSAPALLRIDPKSGTVVKEYPLAGETGGMAVGYDSVWVGNYEANSVTRIPLGLLAP